jgi:ATP-dependent DNA helicase RecG
VAYRIERLRREEIPEYPMAALREAITNAVMHRDWFNEGANVFVEIYTDRIEVSNPGGLPKGMLPSDLGHKSVRRNPLIADLLHRIEFIEKAGTGIKRMREEAKKYGSPEPKFETTGFFTATFYPNPEVRRQALAATVEVTNQVGTKLALSRHQVAPEVAPEVTPEVLRLLFVLKGPMDRQSLQKTLRLKAEKNFRLVYLRPAMNLGLIEMTNPNKPRSSRQRYRITAKGKEMLKKLSRRGKNG